MTRTSTDMDFCNFVAKTSIANIALSWQICSANENKGPLIRGDPTRKNSKTHEGFRTDMFLASSGFYLLIERREATEVIYQLAQLGVYIIPNEYGHDDIVPPNIARKSVKLDGEVLKEALDNAGVTRVRVLSLNLKMDIDTFTEIVRQHGARGSYSVDIATVVQPSEEENDDDDDGDVARDKISLVFKQDVTKRGIIWNILGDLGSKEAAERQQREDGHDLSPCGTAFISCSKQAAGVSKLREVCIYTGGLVHFWKAFDVHAGFESFNTVRAMREQRNTLNAKLTKLFRNNDRNDMMLALHKASSELRIECRFEMEGTTAQAIDMLRRNRVDSISEVNRISGSRFAIVQVGFEDYIAEVRRIKTIMNDPTFKIGRGKDSTQPLPITLTRWSEIKTQLGIHPGSKSLPFLYRYATWKVGANQAEKDDIYRWRSIFEPQDPQFPDTVTVRNDEEELRKHSLDVEEYDEEQLKQERKRARRMRDIELINAIDEREERDKQEKEVIDEIRKELKVMGGPRNTFTARYEGKGWVAKGAETKEELYGKVYEEYGESWKQYLKKK